MSDSLLSTISSNATVLPLNREFDTISDTFRKSMGQDNICVSMIYKIENNALNVRFNERINAITKSRGTEPTIVQVFHGTTLRAAANIVNTGFDPTYSKIAAYGMGTYSSPSAKVATGYCKDVRAVGDFSMIFLCRFIKGLYGKTNNNNRIDIEKMDYCGEHNILVTPYADGIVPDYLICYYKWDT